MRTRRKCTIGSIVSELKKDKQRLILGNIISIFSTFLVVLIPLLIPVIVDELLLGKDHGVIAWISAHVVQTDTKGYVVGVLATTLLLRSFSTGMSMWQTKIFVSISKNITYRMRMHLLEHLKKVSLKEYELMSVGAVASKLVTDIETIGAFIGTTISKLIVSSLILLFSSAVLLWIHWQLALFILLTNPIVVLLTVKLSRNIGKLKKEENRAIESFQSVLSETLDLFHQIRAVNKEAFFFQRTGDEAKKLKERSVAFGYKSDAATKLSYLVFLSGYEIFRAVSILAVAYSDLSVGLMLAIFSYLWVMVTPTQDIIGFQYALATARSACERINAIFDMEREPFLSEKHDPFEGKNAVDIEIESISFAYRENRNILKNINMKIKAGSKVAIVGASGSGKTTLANIINGFYPLKDGEIRYGGVSNRKLNLSTIRENIYLILQHPKLFNDTMRFNLTLGEDYDKRTIENALRIAQLEDFVENLQNGIESPVGRDGVKLSGGQRQRVAIARMVLANPKVVIFDESTSALDVHTEAKLFEALQDFLREKTVITIAHRLSTIKSAEFIFVLEEGRLVDSGTPQELLEKDKSYFSRMI